jgi:hypothetical protein
MQNAAISRGKRKIPAETQTTALFCVKMHWIRAFARQSRTQSRHACAMSMPAARLPPRSFLPPQAARAADDTSGGKG